MLNFEITKQSDSIEKLFCEEFDKLQRIQMDEELSEILISLLFGGSEFKIPENEKPQLFQIIEKRIKACFTYSINDDRLILFLCALTRRPGHAVMYLTYLQYWSKKHNIKNLDLETFSEKIFPVGFPNENQLTDLWDKVKVNKPDGTVFYSDNLLDYQTAMLSIQMEEKN